MRMQLREPFQAWQDHDSMYKSAAAAHQLSRVQEDDLVIETYVSQVVENEYIAYIFMEE